ncbi:MAG: hypothetical protein E6Q97_08170 [Desulfurellales bacterium]|nr:MAG: hypothetical protein E6Q97_08170 [Desulfurellales bacterium]
MNRTLTFVKYEVGDNGISLTFHDPDPGPGARATHTVSLTDGELEAANTLSLLRAAIEAKLQRKLLAQGIADRLEPLLGASLTI